MLLICSVMLCACNEEKAPAKKKPAEISANSIFKANANSKWWPAKGNIIKKNKDSLLFSSKLVKASPGGPTQGVFVAVPKPIEAKVSGKKIKVSIIAKKGSPASKSFAVAYSTSQVGNSGWHTFVPTDQYTLYSFEYTVPKMKSPNSDFVGIWGDTKGTGNGVLIKDVAIEVIS